MDLSSLQKKLALAETSPFLGSGHTGHPCTSADSAALGQRAVAVSRPRAVLSLTVMSQTFIGASEFDQTVHLSMQNFIPGEEVGRSFHSRVGNVYLNVIHSALHVVSEAGGHRVIDRGVVPSWRCADR